MFLPWRCAAATFCRSLLGTLITAGGRFPLGVTPGSDRSATGAGHDRTNATGISPVLDHPTTAEWFNIGAFVLQPLGTYGNAGRNVVIGPGALRLGFLHDEELLLH